jgi:MFS family permease
MCLLASLFYLYEFILQVSPSVIARELSTQFHLNAGDLGLFSAAYYYSYTPMQLPAGMLFDRFGLRNLLTIAILMCALGTFLFASTHDVYVGAFGRFLTGFGSAFSFVGALLLVARWFPPNYFALITGLVETMSCVGAVLGTMPLAYAVARFGWRFSLLGLAISGVILAIFVLCIVRDAPEGALMIKKEKKSWFPNLRSVCRNRQTWWVAAYSFFIWAPITAFAALWGISFLTTVYGLTKTQAATACSLIWIGIGIGSPLLGWISDRINLRCLPLYRIALLGTISLGVLISMPQLSLFWIDVCLFCFGLAASGQALAFGVVKDNNNTQSAGTAIGINNMATVAGGGVLQPLIGFLLVYLGNHFLGDVNAPLNATKYRIALLPLPLCHLIAWVISRFFIRETYCQYVNSNTSK